MPRHGDAETGYGMDLGGRLAWTDRTLLAHVVDGLSVTDDGFDRWRDLLAAANARLLPGTVTRGGRRHGFQNTVVRVQDQYGVGVDGRLLEARH